MTIESRLTNLEASVMPADQQPVRILVVRIPPGLSPEEEEGWSTAHPEDISKVIEVIPGQAGTRVLYSTEPDR